MSENIRYCTPCVAYKENYCLALEIAGYSWLTPDSKWSEIKENPIAQACPNHNRLFDPYFQSLYMSLQDPSPGTKDNLEVEGDPAPEKNQLFSLIDPVHYVAIEEYCAFKNKTRAEMDLMVVLWSVFMDTGESDIFENNARATLERFNPDAAINSDAILEKFYEMAGSLRI